MFTTSFDGIIGSITELFTVIAFTWQGPRIRHLIDNPGPVIPCTANNTKP